MRSLYRPKLKKYFRETFLRTRAEMGLTRDRFAEMLDMDSRSYAYLEKGQHLCSSTTLILYIARICPDPDALATDLQRILTETDHVA